MLQRDATAVVWGFDTAGSTITTNFSGLVLVNKTGADGIWRQNLPPTPAGGPFWITFASSVGGVAALSDILFGDVYLAGSPNDLLYSTASAFYITSTSAGGQVRAEGLTAPV